MSSKSTPDQINQAVQECLAECYRSANPLTSLAGFIDQLRSQSEWTASEIEGVETTVRRILKALVSEI
jgi:hypothetical protein